jgi:SAM-dependent methyltransferase
MKTIRTSVVLGCLAVLAFVAAVHGGLPSHGQDKSTFAWDGLQLALGVSPDVPYVSTPYEIAGEMIRLADVKAHDVVYDLGCGDGRLVIEAVKRAGCRGVGIDIDPERIKESRANAKAAGVEGRVRFVEQNFFVSDIREATVMLIYLFPDINIRLRDKFLGEMRPGSRLVSHAFDMGDWKPDVTSSVLAQRICLWVIPANATGIWTWKAPAKAGGLHRLEIDQRYQQIRGSFLRGGAKTEISGATIRGDRIAFTVAEEANGSQARREFSGTIKGNSITGTFVSRQGARVQNSRWHAVRDPSTRHPIETGYQKSDLLWY